MSKQIINNFVYGETDKNILGRTDLKAYFNSASKIQNFKLNALGGLTRREGTLILKELEKKTRIIPFEFSADLSFLLLFSNKELRIIDCSTEQQIGEAIETDYSERELFDINYAQNEESIFFVHIDHPIKVLDYAGNTFTFSTFVGTYDDEHKNILETENNYPSVVAFCSSRLYFASSRNQPFTIWISQAFEPTNFWTYKVGTTTTETQASMEDYFTQFKKWQDGELENVSVSYDTWTNDLKLTAWWKARVETEGGGDESKVTITYNDLLATNTSLFQEVMTITNIEETKIYTDENAMILELASSKNDKITFISILHNIVIGTRSSEWIIPYNITPSNLSSTKESSYGSTFIQAMPFQNELIFLQSSGCLRSMRYDYQYYNYPCDDRTILNKEILSSGVIEFASQTTPYSRFFCVLKNGNMAVMTKNELDNSYGWTLYTCLNESDNFISVAVAEVDGVQEVFCVMEDENKKYYLCKLTDETLTDFATMENGVIKNGKSFVSEVITNPIESSTLQTLDSIKYGWNISLRTNNTGKFFVGFKDELLQNGDGTAQDIHTIQAPTSWTKDLRVQVKSNAEDPLTINAILINMGAI